MFFTHLISELLHWSHGSPSHNDTVSALDYFLELRVSCLYNVRRDMNYCLFIYLIRRVKQEKSYSCRCQLGAPIRLNIFRSYRDLKVIFICSCTGLSSLGHSANVLFATRVGDDWRFGPAWNVIRAPVTLSQWAGGI